MSFEDAMDKGCRWCAFLNAFSDACRCALYEQDIDKELPCKKTDDSDLK